MVECMDKLLMCPPTNFEIAYTINPWMSVGAPTDHAGAQWQRLVDLLRDDTGAHVEFVEPAAGVPDLVFTANAALISGSLAIVSSFRFAERQPETAIYRRCLDRLGYETRVLSDVAFEGAGDALFDRRLPLLYFGYGWRSDADAAGLIERMTGVQTLPLRLVDPRFYHLDTCLCPLGSGHVMAFMDAFSSDARAQLRQRLGPEYLIEVSLDDALAFACNAVEVGDAIVLHSATAQLRERLERAGYRVLATDLSEFHKSGGSAKCLTLKLYDAAVSRAA
jgi:N-dimethylarginine dimethylaminohydrolase